MTTVSRDAVRYTGLCIDGVWKGATAGQTFGDVNPATGEVSATLAEVTVRFGPQRF